ncbi:MAG: hypothetical protein J6W13_04260 [Salinivirgaceae bacterium]|nr:hypothetical protein [Salinivirgaceae bacterium]
MRTRDSRLRRTHKIVITLNDYELSALESYCKKSKVTDRTKFIREQFMSKVMVSLCEEYHPTLFDKDELSRL